MVVSLCRGWARCQRPGAQVRPKAALLQGCHRLSAPQARLDFAQNQGVTYFHDGKGEEQKSPEIRVLLPPDGRSEGGAGSWGWSSSFLTPLDRFSRADPRKVDSRDTRQLTRPWEPTVCLALPDSAHPWPSIHLPRNEEIGLALLEGWRSSLSLLRNCAEKHVPVAPERSGPGWRNSQIPLAKTQMQLREAGLCAPGGGLHTPCGTPLSLEGAFQAPPLWEKPTESSAKWKPFAFVPIIVKSVQGSQRNGAFGSCSPPCMSLATHRDGVAL